MVKSVAARGAPQALAPFLCGSEKPVPTCLRDALEKRSQSCGILREPHIPSHFQQEPDKDI
jgi:hypothetical protein